jgi:hypothetical protein
MQTWQTANLNFYLITQSNMKNETLQYENGEISEKEYFSWLSSKLAKNRTEK